jgi:hypothetical protein
MSDNMNFKKGEGDLEKDPEESGEFHRPKHIFRKNHKNDPLRSKSAPAEEFSNTDETEDYLSSYNYFIYYNSIKPNDPRLPKPTYKPKPNLDFIKESRDKEEEDEEQQEAGNDNINSIENITKEMNQLNLDQNQNLSNNNQNLIGKNIFNDNYMNNFPKNPNIKNNLNQNNEAPSPFDYYTQSMNVPNQQNDLSQQQILNENLSMNSLGMYNHGLVDIGGMVGMGMNPLMGMNMGMNLYVNVPQYGNMMGMNPSLMNVNGRINSGMEQMNHRKKMVISRKEIIELKKVLTKCPFKIQCLIIFIIIK